MPAGPSRSRSSKRRSSSSRCASVTGIEAGSVERLSHISSMSCRRSSGDSFPTSMLAMPNSLSPLFLRANVQSLTTPRIGADDDPDACTSGWPTHPASANRRRRADASCIPAVRLRRSDRSIHSICVPRLRGHVDPRPPAPSSSANSCAAALRWESPSISPNRR